MSAARLHPTVVKLGGGAMAEPGLTTVAGDLAALATAGRAMIVVHGGGPQTTVLQEQLGQQVRRVSGRRITDQPALDAIKMMVGGKLNIDLCAALLAAGAHPVGLHGASSAVIAARRRPPRRYPGAGEEPIDMGLVGDVTGTNATLLDLLLDAGHLPVLACIGAGADGAVYNINADVVAHRLAVELGAEALVLVSDIRGVLRERSDPGSRIAELSASEAHQLIEDGTVREGMIPKIEESLHALDAGVGRVHIVGELAPTDLRREIEQPGSIGTALHG